MNIKHRLSDDRKNLPARMRADAAKCMPFGDHFRMTVLDVVHSKTTADLESKFIHGYDACGPCMIKATSDMFLVILAKRDFSSELRLTTF